MANKIQKNIELLASTNFKSLWKNMNVTQPTSL